MLVIALLKQSPLSVFVYKVRETENNNIGQHKHSYDNVFYLPVVMLSVVKWYVNVILIRDARNYIPLFS